MNDTITITESGGAPVRKGKRWLVTIARPGQGSTGYYPEAVLRESGPQAFPPGTKAFFKHNPDPDVRDMVGVYEDGAFWNDDEGELQGYLTPFPRYAPVLEEAGKHIEASIRAKAVKDPVTGHVKQLVQDRGNTVDLVAFAGLEGSGLKYQVESLFAAAAADGEQGKENKNVDEKLIAALEALTSKFGELSAKFDTFVAESKQEIKGEADAAALETAVESRVEEALQSYDEKIKAIDSADILDVQKESLKVAARKGEDITETLAAAVSFAAEARKELAPNTNGATRDKVVVVTENADTAVGTKTFTPGRWSK